MIVDVVILLVCAFGLWIFNRSRATRQGDAAPKVPPIDLPPAILLAFVGLLVAALSGWISVVSTNGIGVAVDSTFFGGEPVWAVAKCHERQRVLMKDHDFRPALALACWTCAARREDS